MSVRRIAMLSVHTSPLAQPGSGDGGGMNVYVRSLASALARAGVECDVLTRAEQKGVAPIVELEPGLRVVNLRAGPLRPAAKDELRGLVDELVAAARDHLALDTGLRRSARALLDLRCGRPQAQARARSPARDHLPHPGPHEGRGRRRRRPDRPRARRSRGRRVQRPRSSRRPWRSGRSSSPTTAPTPSASR